MSDVEKLLQVKSTLSSRIFGKAPTIEDLAKQSNMSTSQLKSKFKSLFGSTIYKYYLSSKICGQKFIKAKEQEQSPKLAIG